MLQSLAIQKLHHDECVAVLVVNFVNGADVRVVLRRCGLTFALEAGEGLRVFGDVVREEFQGDEAIEFDVLGFVDHTHPAATELLYNAVVRDGLADQRLTLSHLRRY